MLDFNTYRIVNEAYNQTSALGLSKPNNLGLQKDTQFSPEDSEENDIDNEDETEMEDGEVDGEESGEINDDENLDSDEDGEESNEDEEDGEESNEEEDGEGEVEGDSEGEEDQENKELNHDTDLNRFEKSRAFTAFLKKEEKELSPTETLLKQQGRNKGETKFWSGLEDTK